MLSKNVWFSGLIFGFVLTLAGCGPSKPEAAVIPTDLNKSLPKVAAPAGGGAPEKKAANPVGSAD